VLIAQAAPPCKYGDADGRCSLCIVNRLIKESTHPDYAMVEHLCGLLWVGEQFYEKPKDFVEEAQDLGISRRIHCWASRKIRLDNPMPACAGPNDNQVCHYN
jgi:hypothetical protein